LALCGIVAPVLVVLAIAAVASNTPSPDARTDEIMTYYSSHTGSNRAAALMVALAGALIVLFAVRLRDHLDTGAPGASTFARASLAGGVLGAAGLFGAAVVHFALVDAVDDGLTSAVEALNSLDGVMVIAAALGLGVMYFSAGVAVLRQGTLPRWLGWSGVVVGVLTFAGPLGFLGALLGAVWMIATAVVLVRQTDDVTVVAAPLPA
jgi:hypothetical protein